MVAASVPVWSGIVELEDTGNGGSVVFEEDIVPPVVCSVVVFNGNV